MSTPSNLYYVVNGSPLFYTLNHGLPSSLQLQDELNHLHELKLQNIKNVIEVIRMELKSYWDKCFYSEQQRQAFAPYYDGK